MRISQLLRRATSSLLGCAMCFGLVFAIPEWLYLANYLHARESLTVANGLALAAGGLLLGAIGGVLAWFTIFKSFARRNNEGK